MDETEKVGLCILLEKPSEPLVVPKGNGDIAFEMPEAFYDQMYRESLEEVKHNVIDHEVATITVKNTSIPKELIKAATEIGNNFSHFIPKHLRLAMELTNVFLHAKNLEDLLSVAAYCRERLNPIMFNYALTVALTHRKDTHDLLLPNFLHSFPQRFVDATVFSDVRKDASVLSGEARKPIVIKKNFTSSNREPEQAVAYFREDIGVNLHHWHWHMVYPTHGDKAVVEKDRRGELFYYMHAQLLARYNVERLCNKMEMVKSIVNLRDPIKEGYFPKLSHLNANRSWPPRFANVYLYDIDRPGDELNLTINTMEDWMKRIKDAIRNGMVKDENNHEIVLDQDTGIDILGNIIEASDLSANKLYYGNLYNMGQILIAFCHDPEERFLESFGVMGDIATTMRDPVFYRWHSTINELFVSHKKTLLPYTSDQLTFRNITITSLSVAVVGRPLNELNTFWELSDIDISTGLDFVSGGPLPIRITYLQYARFDYMINIRNNGTNAVKGTIRIFMSPKYDIQGNVHMFETERKLMIEMDRFMVSLVPGMNNINRKSSDSSVTIDFESTYRNKNFANIPAKDLAKFNFCGCGWPDNMLIPRGSVNGFSMNLFAMVTDYEVDRVDQVVTEVCPGAESYCGMFDSKYPDTRSMGYPFDRPAESTVTQLDKFLTPNMKVTEIEIVHQNRNRTRPLPATPIPDTPNIGITTP